MPQLSEYLKEVTSRSNGSDAVVKIYEETWNWLKDRGCDNYVKKELVEQYALFTCRFIQCEEGINHYGLLAKNPANRMPIANPYVGMSIAYQRQATEVWQQIARIVDEHFDGSVNKSHRDGMIDDIIG